MVIQEPKRTILNRTSGNPGDGPRLHLHSRLKDPQDQILQGLGDQGIVKELHAGTNKAQVTHCQNILYFVI